MKRPGILPVIVCVALFAALLARCAQSRQEPSPGAGLQPTADVDTLLPTPSVQVTPDPTSPPFVFPTASHSETNILLIGVDKRGDGDTTWRTDTIMWVSVRRSPDQIGIVSIPRDLWLDIPRIGKNRVNVADYYGETLKYPGGGPGLLADTIKNNLGLKVDRFVRLDFQAFEKVVDSMGGITVDVDCPVYDKFYDSSAPNGYRILDVKSGRQRMDGVTALMYARSRHGNSDPDRARRQQRVLLGVRERALQVNVLPRIPQLWASLSKSVKTDLSLPDILSLAVFATQMDQSGIRGVVIDLTMTSNWTTPQGWMVLLPDMPKIRQAIGSLFDGPSLIETTAKPSDRCPQ